LLWNIDNNVKKLLYIKICRVPSRSHFECFNVKSSKMSLNHDYLKHVFSAKVVNTSFYVLIWLEIFILMFWNKKIYMKLFLFIGNFVSTFRQKNPKWVFLHFFLTFSDFLFWVKIGEKNTKEKSTQHQTPFFFYIWQNHKNKITYFTFSGIYHLFIAVLSYASHVYLYQKI